MPADSLKEIEDWLLRLEMKYIALAVEVARYEKHREAGSLHEDYDEMDRIARDIERARQARDLCRQLVRSPQPAEA